MIYARMEKRLRTIGISPKKKKENPSERRKWKLWYITSFKNLRTLINCSQTVINVPARGDSKVKYRASISIINQPYEIEHLPRNATSTLKSMKNNALTNIYSK